MHISPWPLGHLADAVEAETEPRFRVDLDGRVMPANEAGMRRRFELNRRDREEAPPWSWLVGAAPSYIGGGLPLTHWGELAG